MIPISVCIIARNEEDNIEKCLQPLRKHPFEIVVIDTGSTDKTMELAGKYADKVLYFPWCDDFSQARNFSISHASHDWVLILDCDEVVKNIDFTDSYTTSKQMIIVKNPDAASAGGSISEKFNDNFVKDSRWEYLIKGLGNTLLITLFAIIIGIVLGFLIAIVRTNHDKNGGLTILNAICKVYLTIVRGTPVMVQLLIIYYVIFAVSYTHLTLPTTSRV